MAITKVELQSSFVKEGLESQEHKQKIKALEDWFTSAQTAAQTQYQATAQQAAAQASYDISGAYANYLKQQRSVAAAGQLESGYKQELGDIAQSQFQSAYGQAKATEAQTVMGAAQTAQKDIAEAASQYSKYTKSLEENLLKEAKIKANLYKTAEEMLGATDDAIAYTEYGAPIYDESGKVIDKGKGIYDAGGKLTAMGTALFQEMLMSDRSYIEKLEELGMDEELEYYFANSQNLHKELFGFEEYYWNETLTKGVKLQTKGYIESIEQPSLDVSVWNSKGKIEDKLATSKDDLTDYANKLGLSKQELNVILNKYNDSIANVGQTKGIKNVNEYDEAFRNATNEVLKLAKSKYRGE